MVLGEPAAWPPGDGSRPQNRPPALRARSPYNSSLIGPGSGYGRVANRRFAKPMGDPPVPHTRSRADQETSSSILVCDPTQRGAR
jgi:hypothetical protein